MTNVIIDYEKCEGINCAECVDVCPMEIFVIGEDRIIIQNTDQCSLCEVCMDICPNTAITVKDE